MATFIQEVLRGLAFFPLVFTEIYTKKNTYEVYSSIKFPQRNIHILIATQIKENVTSRKAFS